MSSLEFSGNKLEDLIVGKTVRRTVVGMCFFKKNKALKGGKLSEEDMFDKKHIPL